METLSTGLSVQQYEVIFNELLDKGKNMYGSEEKAREWIAQIINSPIKYAFYLALLTYRNRTMLKSACASLNVELIQLLILWGAKVNTSDNLLLPLNGSTHSQLIKVIATLLGSQFGLKIT